MSAETPLASPRPIQMTSSSPEGHGGARMFRYAWAALGTQCELQFVCDSVARAEAFQNAALAWVENFEARYSRFRPQSEISRINDAAGKHEVTIDGEMERILDVCAAIWRMTDGILDVTALPLMRLWNYRAPSPQIPQREAIEAACAKVGWTKVQRRPGRIFLPIEGMSIDLGGWGKEYAVDAVVELARSHKIESGLVDFGHDVRAWGAPIGRPAWHIGLEDPQHPGTHRGSIALFNRAVASSGDYLRNFSAGGRRFGHIIDPRTGEPVSNGCAQTTVVAHSCLQAGILSTTAFILGPIAGLKLIQDSMGAEGLIVTRNARHQTRNFFQYVVSQ
ncbi:MAG TPA: FAD:protein FMN transferase [Opitutaceae bacterium]